MGLPHDVGVRPLQLDRVDAEELGGRATRPPAVACIRRPVRPAHAPQGTTRVDQTGRGLQVGRAARERRRGAARRRPAPPTATAPPGCRGPARLRRRAAPRRRTPGRHRASDRGSGTSRTWTRCSFLMRRGQAHATGIRPGAGGADAQPCRPDPGPVHASAWRSWPVAGSGGGGSPAPDGGPRSPVDRGPGSGPRRGDRRGRGHYLYQHGAVAYSCAYAGLRLTDSRAIVSPAETISIGPRSGLVVSTFASVHGLRLAAAAWRDVGLLGGSAAGRGRRRLLGGRLVDPAAVMPVVRELRRHPYVRGVSTRRRP